MTEFNQEQIIKRIEEMKAAGYKGRILERESTNNQETPEKPKNPLDELEFPTFSNLLNKKEALIIQKAYSRIKKPRNKNQLQSYYGNVDIIILTFLTVCSSALPNIRFLYRRDWYYPSLMTCIIANAGMGKGVMDSIFSILRPICQYWDHLYQTELRAYKDQQESMRKMSKKELKNFSEEILEKPSHYLFHIPTDSTYAAFIKALSVMKGTGAVLDTEIDTLNHSFKQEMGDYSVLLRKNFKHECHEMYRKTEDEYISIPEPKFAMAISGTLDQLLTFIDNVDNGLFSRFIYYFYTARPTWQNAIVENDCEVDDKTFYEEMGKDILRLYEKLKSLHKPIRFLLTERQIKKMNVFFDALHGNYLSMEGDEIHATIVRLAIILQRIALLLTILRHTDKSDEELDRILKGDITCLDKDYNLAMTICEVLIQHASVYYERLKNHEAQDEEEEIMESADFGRDDVNLAFQSLPAGKILTRHDIVSAMTSAGVPSSTASKYIPKFLKKLWLKKTAHNQYRKFTNKEYKINQEKAKSKKRK